MSQETSVQTIFAAAAEIVLRLADLLAEVKQVDHVNPG
jgi:hypothetical protein